MIRANAGRVFSAGVRAPELHMPCCLIIIASMFPRIALGFMWITGYGGRAFETVLWPLLGFFFMPFTTCFYAIGINAHGDIRGWALAFVIIGVLFDFGSHGGGARSARHRYADHPH